jgi:outer membrane usher protein
VNRQRLGAAALASVLLAAAASAEERPLVLEVIINGRATGRVGEFVDRDGALFAKPSELHELGFALPPNALDLPDNDPIPLSSLPNVQAKVNQAKQTLVVEAGDDALLASQLGNGSSVALAPLSPAGYGAVFNYDAVGTFTSEQSTGAALLDFRAFSPYGVVQSTGIGNVTPGSGQQNFQRLDTTYTYSEADAERRWRAGDVVTGALSWSRSVRLGGFQLASDFTLRPDLITYPLPVISSSAAVPSAVDVLVNGIRQYSAPVEPGPCAVQTLPVVTGAGEVAVTVEDALGRQTLVTLPFYAASTLLKPGLASYSLEGGTVRQNYGLSTNGYLGWATNGSLRYGLNDWLTLEGHGEATGSLALLGTGAAVQVGTVGVVNVATAASTGYGSNRPPGSGNTGGLASASFQRLSHNLSLSVGGTISTNGYHDIAAVNGAPVPKSTLNASVGYTFGSWGSVGVSYVRQASRAQTSAVSLVPPALSVTPLDYSAIINPQAELVNASYSIPIGGVASFYATGYMDLHTKGNYGIGVGISFTLGPVSASVGTAYDGGHASYLASAVKPALEENDYGYRLQDSEGAVVHRSAEAEFLSPWGLVSGEVDQSPGEIGGRFGARGSVVWADGGLFAADRINDSFAVVNTGDVAGVPVLYENRPVGKTDASGQLMVPSLLSYQNNRLAVDTAKLPPDISVGQTAVLVRPADRSGVIVDFHIKKMRAALLKLTDGHGQPIPLGSVAKIEGAEDQPVGYDGEAYVTGLRPTNRMEVVVPRGSTCVVEFDYKPVKDQIPVIGPLVCK